MFDRNQGDYESNAAGLQNNKENCEDNNAEPDAFITFDCEAKMSQVCPVTCDTCPYDRLFASFLLFLGYGLAIIPSTYVFSYIFSEHMKAQLFTILVNLIMGLVLMLVSFVLDVAFIESNPGVADANKTLKWFYRFSPGFCLGNGLLTMAFSSLGLKLGSGTFGVTVGPNNPTAWDEAGRDIFFLFLSAPLYWALTVLIDIMQSYPQFASLCGGDPKVAHVPWEDDVDVANEAARVSAIEDGSVSDIDPICALLHCCRQLSLCSDSLLVRCPCAAMSPQTGIVRMRKVYPGGCCGRQSKVALHCLSFGVHKGECFGYLGINGAGKSTTMNILTGNFLASSGDAYLTGLNIKTHQREVRAKLGYCPQFDALLELCSVREHLQLFGRIKGLSGTKLESVVKTTIEEMDLKDFEHKLAGTLSGGNKRKLSVGIATIGRPPLVFLDEVGWSCPS